MISHKLKCIFIHIGRVGGKSIEKVMFDVEPARGSSCHNRIWQWQDELDKEIFDQYFKFCFCRNPWDRMVSLYSYYLQISGYMTPNFKKSRFMIPGMFRSFKSFVKLIDPEKLKSVVPTQLQWIVDIDGNVKVDFIGKFENFTDDWNKICKKVGISKPLPHLNKSVHNNYKTYYDDDLIQIVGEKYKEDVEFFEYEF